DVERLTFGFDALAHHGRQVVFVPYAAPGERVRAEVVERRAGYLRARVAAVLAPGPDRVLPGCRYFPTCGGCQWQHVAPPAQRDAKAAIVAEQLARTAGVRDAEVLPTLAARDWQYRARITLVVEGRRAGYHRADANRLLVASVIALGGFAPGERVLDLYAGAGNFTLPIARRGARVVGIERNPVAAAAGPRNALRLGLGGVAFETSAVHDALARRA